MITHLLRLKGVTLTEGSQINMQAYLFRTLIKGTKKKSTKKVATTEDSESSNVPLSQVVSKDKRMRKKKAKAQVFEEGSNEDELISRKAKIVITENTIRPYEKKCDN